MQFEKKTNFYLFSESEQKDSIEGEGESETHASGSGLESGDEDAELVKRGIELFSFNYLLCQCCILIMTK